MIKAVRSPKNPIFVPNKKTRWEAEATFNGCVIKSKNQFHLVYRAISVPQQYFGKHIELSSIGYAQSRDGINFRRRRRLITPEYQWEQFGCEDPRVTKIGDQYYIFYTALSDWPPTPEGIHIGLARTPNFKEITEKHQVTHFNSKAMALFPEKIKDQYCAVLTVDTDRPPAKIALAFFDYEDQIWSKEHWDNWLPSLDKYTLPLQRNPSDQVEVGAPPLKTENGWLLIYSYIKNYRTPPRTFAIEAVLLDKNNPFKIIGRTQGPLLVPEAEYELYGKIPNVIFPSGALIKRGKVYLYYGAADTTCCLAQIKLKDLLAEMTKKKTTAQRWPKRIKLERFSGNPIIKPKAKHDWEAQYTFNPGALYLAGKVHLLYRAMGKEGVSTLGYASSKDGLHFNERLDEPVYIPRENFEKKLHEGYAGCEDARLTQMGKKIYMCYTAHDGAGPTRVALTTIKINDFLNKCWNWTKPLIISFPDRSDKNACLLSAKIKGKYVFFHRIGGCIWIDFVENLNFGEENWLGGKIMLCPRPSKWDSRKIGIAGPPIKTEDGWLLIYHGLSQDDDKYRLGALLLDLKNPDEILSHLDYPLLEPESEYERSGLRHNTVFSCGAVVIKGRLFVYYGAADQVIGVATTNLSLLLKALKRLYQP